MKSFTSGLSLVMPMMMMILKMSSVKGFPQGAPNFLCNSMRPGHPYRERVYSPDTFPFKIDLSSRRTLPGDIVTVTVSVRNANDTFRGLLATAVDPDFNVVSGFVQPQDNDLKMLSCTWSDRTVENSALTHANRFPDTTKTKTFLWQIPKDAALGSRYTIRFTVVRYVTTYWVGVNSTFTIGQPTPPDRPAESPDTKTTPTDSGSKQPTSSSANAGNGVPSPANAGSATSSTGNASSNSGSGSSNAGGVISTTGNASSNSGSGSSNAGGATSTTGNAPSNSGSTPSGSRLQARPTSTTSNSSNSRQPGNILERHPGASNMVHGGRRPSSNAPRRNRNRGLGRAAGEAGTRAEPGAGTGPREGSGAGTGPRAESGAETGAGQASGMSAWLAGWFGR